MLPRKGLGERYSFAVGRTPSYRASARTQGWFGEPAPP